MICSECKSKFKFKDRIKSINRRKGKIQCENCKGIFAMKWAARIEIAIVTGIIVFISSMIGLTLIGQNSENKIVGALIIGFLTYCILVIYYFIAQNWWKYEKINENSEK